MMYFNTKYLHSSQDLFCFTQILIIKFFHNYCEVLRQKVEIITTTIRTKQVTALSHISRRTVNCATAQEQDRTEKAKTYYPNAIRVLEFISEATKKFKGEFQANAKDQKKIACSFNSI